MLPILTEPDAADGLGKKQERMKAAGQYGTMAHWRVGGVIREGVVGRGGREGRGVQVCNRLADFNRRGDTVKLHELWMH